MSGRGIIDTTTLHNRKWRTFQPVREERDVEGNQGADVYHWPEFKAFAKRLGIAHELPTLNITITIPVDGVVVVAHDYQGEDRHLPQPEPS